MVAMLEDTMGNFTVPDHTGAGKWKDFVNIEPIFIDKTASGMDGTLEMTHRMNDIIKRTRKHGLTIEKYF